MTVPQTPRGRRVFRGIGLATAAVTAAATLALGAVAPVLADGATVTGGDLHAFATSTDPGSRARRR